MVNRRDFFIKATAAALTTSAPGPLLQAAGKPAVAAAASRVKVNNAARSALPEIKSVVRREDTIVRLGGDGRNFDLTWRADDRQVVSVLDGCGWPQWPRDHFYMTRLFALGGNPQTAAFQEILNYPDTPLGELLMGTVPAYYGHGLLAVDGRIYQYLSSVRRPWVNGVDPGPKAPWMHWDCVKLVYSVDNGQSWLNQDGSPATFEMWREQSRKTMVFFEEPQDTFCFLSCLQMGKDYQDNHDGYVYVYSPNGCTEDTMNQLVMFRVPKDKVLDRGSYEYFGGLRGDGTARWVKDINARGVVHTFPRGLVGEGNFLYSWRPSVVYNAPLGVYMMVNASHSWHGTNPGKAVEDQTLGGTADEKPNYLGIWIAKNPWGPWSQVHEETSWTTAGNSMSRPTEPVIAPKWISEDGKSFWLVWTELQDTTSEPPQLGEARNKGVIEHNRPTYGPLRILWYMYHQLYSLNTQRVDLVL